VLVVDEWHPPEVSSDTWRAPACRLSCTTRASGRFSRHASQFERRDLDFRTFDVVPLGGFQTTAA
jgi:hypothetical protein